MIKKLNAVLLLLITLLFAAKVGVKFVKEHAAAASVGTGPVAVVRNAEFAPHVLFETWVPYATVNPRRGRNGYILDVVRAIFPRATFVQHELSVDRTLEIFASDPHAVSVIYGDHPRLKDMFSAPTPLTQVELRLYHKRSTRWKYSGAESLKSIRIGISEGYLDNPLFRRLAEEAKAESREFRVFEPSSPYFRNAHKALDDGVVDAIGFSRIAFDAANLGITADTLMQYTSTPTICEAPIYFTVSNKDPTYAKRLVEAFEKGYREIEASGELRRIREYYEK